MTNHIHLIVSSDKDKDIATTIRDFKRFKAKKLYELLNSDYRESRRNWLNWIFESQGALSSSNKKIKIWRHENHPVPLEINSMLNQKLDYLSAVQSTLAGGPAREPG